jgi:hypothetical protein
VTRRALSAPLADHALEAEPAGRGDEVLARRIEILAEAHVRLALREQRRAGARAARQRHARAGRSRVERQVEHVVDDLAGRPASKAFCSAWKLLAPVPPASRSRRRASRGADAAARAPRREGQPRAPVVPLRVKSRTRRRRRARAGGSRRTSPRRSSRAARRLVHQHASCGASVKRQLRRERSRASTPAKVGIAAAALAFFAGAPRAASSTPRCRAARPSR